MILTLNSSLPPYELALFHNSHKPLARCDLASMQLSESLFSNLTTLIKDHAKVNQIKGIALAKGPGPFTSLRVGMTSVRTMAQVLNIPIKGFCSLKCMVSAYRAFNGLYIATIPAYRDHYHVRLFGIEKQLIQAKSSLLLLSEQQLKIFVSEFKQHVYLLGSFKTDLMLFLKTCSLNIIEDPIIRSRDLYDLFCNTNTVSADWRDLKLVYKQT